MTTIADTIRKGIAAGQDNAQVLAAVKAAHPDANTSPACVSYYRSKMKLQGGAFPKVAKAPVEKKLAAATATSTGYSVAKLKTFIGMEGHGFNVDLLLDGKKVAFVRDDADGGPLAFEWVDDGRPPVPMGHAGHHAWVVPAVQGDLRDFVKGLAPVVCDFEDPNTCKPAVLAMTEDLYITGLVQDLQWIREYKRITKKAIVYIKDGQLYSAKVEPTEKNLAGYKAKFPNFEYVNGLDDAKALEIMRRVS
jgi:hypothetical protein